MEVESMGLGRFDAGDETEASHQCVILELQPCPFCGGRAEVERYGTRRQSCVICCEDCGARLETSEEGRHCGTQWNRRQSSNQEKST